jgi:uncharacterized membrane protein
MIAGLLLFFAAHAVSIVAPSWRDAMVGRWGARRWRAAYSIVSALGLVLIIKGFALARLTPAVLYVPQVWMHRTALLLLLPVFPLLLATYLPGRISATAKHPTLLAVTLWALAHLLTNGMVHEVILFGSFLLWAVADRISLKRRVARPVSRLESTSLHDWLALLLGLALYGEIVVWAHLKFIGVAPLS